METARAMSESTLSDASAPLFIVMNPASGKHDAGETRCALSQVFSKARRDFRFVRIDHPRDLQQASDGAAAEAAACGGFIIAVGGDGTLNTVAQAAWKHQCAMGVIPQGTFNYFGRSQGISQDAPEAARLLLTARPEAVQVGLVNERIFLVNASLGLYPQLLQDRETFKNQFGRYRWVAVLSGLVTLFRWRRQLTLDVALDGRRETLRTPTLFVGNNRLQLERIGIEDKVAQLVGEDRLAAVAAQPIGTWTMLWLLLRGAFGTLGEAQQVRDFAFHTLDVRVVGMRKLKLAVDGEVSTVTPPLRFAVAPRPLMLLLPRPQDRVAVQ